MLFNFYFLGTKSHSGQNPADPISFKSVNKANSIV